MPQYLNPFTLETLGQAFAYLNGIENDDEACDSQAEVVVYARRPRKEKETVETSVPVLVHGRTDKYTRMAAVIDEQTEEEETETWRMQLDLAAFFLEWSSAIKKATEKTTATGAPVLARGQFGYGLRRTVVITVRDGAKRRENGHYNSSSSSWKETTKRKAQYLRHESRIASTQQE